MIYAQITNGIVTAITESHGPISSPDMVARDSFDASIIGYSYADGVFTPPAPTVDANAWLIYVGPFYDRFGSLKLPILASTDPVVQAIIKDSSIRKFIDLRRPDLAQALDAIISKGFAIDKTAILTTPVPLADRYNG